jgi:hypothetical protein
MSILSNYRHFGNKIGHGKPVLAPDPPGKAIGSPGEPRRIFAGWLSGRGHCEHRCKPFVVEEPKCPNR